MAVQVDMMLNDGSRMARPIPAFYLRAREFDLLLIVGLTVVSLATGAVIGLHPAALGLVLLADNWILGFPHVTATFTRLCPDRASLRRHRFLVFGLPPIVIAVTAALALGLGIWAVATIYFYWQWFHTVRQSWGISQLYRRKAQGRVGESERFGEALFYLVPVWGLLHRLTTAPDHFLYPSLPIATPFIPVMLANGVGVAACLGLAWWAIQRVREAFAGTLPILHTAFSFSHYAIFIIGYIVMDDLSGGWIVTNIWHTGQYLMLVWMFNEKTASAGDAHGFRWLTRGNRPWPYFLLCFLVAFPVYFLIGTAFASGASGIVIALIANQTLNFHHFIVDSVIWRSRRRPA